MLTQAVIQSSSPMTLKVEDIDPDEILFLKSIAGLSPEGITLFTGDFARDGGYYQGRRIGKRNVVFTLKMNPNYADDIEISDIRELLYQAFLEPTVGSDAVQVLLEDDRRPDRYFIGYTEDINTDMWEKDQKVTISLLCVDPYLRSAAVTSASDPTGWISVPLTYDGSAGTGFTMQIKMTATTTSLYISLNGGIMLLQPVGGFVNNDIVDINTTIGQRSIKKNGVDIMGSLQGTPVWPTLNSVANTLLVHGGVLSDGKAKVMSYSYRSAWWGI
jgi:hypothetical protein